MKTAKDYKYVLPPLKDCIWCNGEGNEYIECGNELSGYDFRDICRCMKRDKRFKSMTKEE